MMEWWAAKSAGAGRVGGRLLNFVADAHCSPIAHQAGVMIASIWLTPAGGQAIGAGATELERAAGCDLWNQSESLKRQLKRVGTDVTRQQAMELIKNGTYVRDPETGTWFKSSSLQGIWLVVRPFAPYVGGAVALYLVIRAAR